LLVFIQEGVVSFIGMPLNVLVEIVGPLGIHGVEDYDKPVVAEGEMRRHHPIPPARVPAEILHDQKMVQLIPRLREVQFDVVVSAPPTKRLVQM
jgi:hypothetical protein